MPSVFTKIRMGEIPGHLLYEDALCFAILTLGPHNPGHLMVIPVQEIADWQELPKETYQRVMEVAQFFGKATKSIYDCPKVALAVVGFEVPHVHVHVFSLFETSDIDHTNAKIVDPELLKPEAKKFNDYIDKLGGVEV